MAKASEGEKALAPSPPPYLNWHQIHPIGSLLPLYPFESNTVVR